jgi:hypothetical protein
MGCGPLLGVPLFSDFLAVFLVFFCYFGFGFFFCFLGLPVWIFPNFLKINLFKI